MLKLLKHLPLYLYTHSSCYIACCKDTLFIFQNCCWLLTYRECFYKEFQIWFDEIRRYRHLSMIMTMLILYVGIFLHCLRCNIRMDECFIRSFSHNPSYFQSNKETFQLLLGWRIWSSIYSLPQRHSKNSFLWTSWNYIFLPCAINFALPLGVLLSCLYHLSQPG